jgi:hypothetical protein
MGSLYLIMAQVSRVWFKTVEAQYRIRIGAEIAEIVPWLKATAGFQKECVGWLGPNDQFHISEELPGKEVLTAAHGSLRQSKMSPHEITTQWSRLARLSALSWPVSFSFEPASDRFSFGLPEEPRGLGILPSRGRVAICAIYGAIEIWKIPDFLAHSRNTSNQIADVIAKADEELRDRG